MNRNGQTKYQFQRTNKENKQQQQINDAKATAASCSIHTFTSYTGMTSLDVGRRRPNDLFMKHFNAQKKKTIL